MSCVISPAFDYVNINNHTTTNNTHNTANINQNNNNNNQPTNIQHAHNILYLNSNQMHKQIFNLNHLDEELLKKNYRKVILIN